MDISDKEERWRAYMRDYMRQHYKHITLMLKKGEDDDIIERLGTVPVKSDYLKELVRNDIRKEQRNIRGDQK